MTTDNRTNEELAERLRQFAESQAMDFDSPHIAMTLNEVADALEAATRVPVHGEPNDDREVLAKVLSEFGAGTYLSMADAVLDAGFSRATVPDVREHLHAKCDCVPDLGPAHCHLCGRAKGSPVPWNECEAVEWACKTCDGIGLIGSNYMNSSECQDCEPREQRRRAEAERDAALAALERVRALETFSITDSYPAWTAVDHDDLLAALDGAPEPEEKL